MRWVWFTAGLLMAASAGAQTIVLTCERRTYSAF